MALMGYRPSPTHRLVFFDIKNRDARFKNANGMAAYFKSLFTQQQHSSMVTTPFLVTLFSLHKTPNFV